MLYKHVDCRQSVLSELCVVDAVVDHIVFYDFFYFWQCMKLHINIILITLCIF